MGRSTAVLALGAALAVTSCANTYHVDDTSGQSLILSARDRVILTKKRVSNDPTVPVVCAEPNPDVAVGRNVEVTLTGNVTPAEAAPGGSVSGNVRETLLALTRSNAIQVLRDVGYRACEAYMNEAIGMKEYDRILGGTGTTITAVVAVEALREQLRADGKAADAIKEVVQIVNGSHINQQQPATDYGRSPLLARKPRRTAPLSADGFREAQGKSRAAPATLDSTSDRGSRGAVLPFPHADSGLRRLCLRSAALADGQPGRRWRFS